MSKFERLEKIIKKDDMTKLKNSTILVLGIGGVGGYVVESLARSGIGKIIIVDKDKVDESNINRQIIALNSTIGKRKVDVFEERIHDINTECSVIKIDEFINKDNIDILFKEKIDYLVDACDTVSTKIAVMEECLIRKIKFISSMGTGNKFHPELLEITDIRKTINDPLAKIIRKYVKDNRINDKIMVLSSREVPVHINDRVVGSTSFVPPSAGLLITSYIINNIIK
ncbi:MAG: tRNA threonylcarbamoyladenosine dehydratase [Bacilli bacterium]|nr:tRNA threonylcarbamoyladenosine dehydratase [Bacilli bacterium]